MINTDPGALVNAFGSAIIVLVGLWVWHQSRDRTGRAFAMFTGGFGVGVALWNLAPRTDPLFTYYFAPASAGLVVAAVGLWRLAHRFPTPLLDRDRALVRWPRILAGAFAVLYYASQVPIFRLAGGTMDPYQRVWGYPLTADAATWAWNLGWGVFFLALLYALFLFAARARDAPPERFGEYAWMSAAMVLYPAYFSATIWTIPSPPYGFEPFPVAGMAMVGILSAMWLRNTLRGARPRMARTVAWVCLGAMVAGMVTIAALGDAVNALAAGAFGVTRIVMALVLGVAILRHRLFDIEFKVKRGIRQSTVAAAFIAVFFVVSEGAQQFFQGTSLGPWLGIAAAGALVFALAPLQRAAERVADAALPHVEDTDAYREERKGEVYKATLRTVLMDRTVTREEELTLARLAEELGLGAGRAVELRQEVEDELDVEGAAT